MNSAEVEVRIAHNTPQHGLKVFLINTKRRRFAPHLHRSALAFFVWVDPDGNSGTHTQPLADRTYAVYFQIGFGMDLTDSSGNDHLQFEFRFAGPGKDDRLWQAAGASRNVKLPDRGDFQTAPFFQEEPQKCWVRIRLNRVVDRKLWRQSASQG